MECELHSANWMMTSLKATIFEVHGIVVDSCFAQASSWKEALDEEGVRSTFEEIRSLIGMGYEQLVPKLAGVERSSMRGQEIVRRYDQIFQTRYLSKLKPLPQAKEFIKKLKLEGVKIGIVTTATPQELEKILQMVDITECIDAKQCRDETVYSFQGLEQIEEILDQMGFEPEEVVLIGHTPYELEAAKCFGMKSIAFKSGGWSEEDLKCADNIYRDPADLLEQFVTSPFSSQLKAA